MVDDNDNDKAAVAPPNGNRSPRENGGSNGDAASAKKEGSTGAVSPSSARSTPASGASGGGKKEEKAGEGAAAAVPAKMSPPAARALAGLGKSWLRFSTEMYCIRLGIVITTMLFHPYNDVCPRFASGYPFPDGIPPPGAVFNGFRPPIPGAIDPTRPLPPGLVAGKP